MLRSSSLTGHQGMFHQYNWEMTVIDDDDDCATTIDPRPEQYRSAYVDMVLERIAVSPVEGDREWLGSFDRLFAGDP
jgi:hypothetical protein